MSVLFYNIASIPSNLEKFIINEIPLCAHSLQIMCFCETRLSNDIEHLYTLEGYRQLTNNRNHYGGGVCIYINNKIRCHRLQDLCLMSDYIESLFISIVFAIKSVVFGVINRRPNSNLTTFISILDKLLSNISQTGKPCIIMGDFNINILSPLEITIAKHILTFLLVLDTSRV